MITYKLQYNLFPYPLPFWNIKESARDIDEFTELLMVQQVFQAFKIIALDILFWTWPQWFLSR